MNWKKYFRLCGRMILGTLGIILLIGGIVFLYLGAYGVPRRYVDRLLDKLQPEGYVVTVGKLRLTLTSGIVVEGLRVFENEDQVQPMFETKRATLFVNPFDWLQGKAGLRSRDAAPVTHPLDHLHGRLTLRDVNAMGIWIDKVFAGFAISEGWLNINPIIVGLGKGQQDGKIKGQAGYHLESGNYHGGLESIIHPRLLIPILNSNQAEMVNSFVFRGPPIAIDVDFSGRTENNNALWVSGLIQSSNFTYQTVPITSFKTRFGYTNGIISLTAIRLVRPEGEFTGHFEANINSNIANLDLVNTVDPTAIARLAGPEIAAYLDGVRLGGPVRIAVRGCLDYGNGALTDIHAELDGSRLEYAALDVDRCSLKLTVKQLRIDLTDIQAELYGGTIAGSAAFYPVGAITNFKYEVSLKGDDLNLNTLVKSLDYKGDEDYKGSIYSECTVSGFFGKDRNDTISGNGWVRIQDGQLFQRNLLDGFSHLFSVLYPGMGTISLTDLSTEFTVQDQKVKVQNVTLSGPTFSILGKGYYAFDETLDFIVWLQPPESKTIIDRLSEISQPLLSNLLVVRLTGTVSDLKWWPLNLSGDQLLALPKDIVVNMPVNVLKGLSKDLLTALPIDVLGALPKKLFINLPKGLLKMLKPSLKKE